MTAKASIECVVAIQTTGTRTAWPPTGAAPNLTTLNVQDVTRNFTRSEIDVTGRTDPYRLFLAAIPDVSIEFQVNNDPASATFLQMQNAFQAAGTGTTVAFWIGDGPAATVGSRGFWADWKIVGFTFGESLDGASRVTVTIRPTPSAVAPAATVTA